MTTVVFTVPLPPPALSPNSRANRYRKAQATAAYRQAVRIAVLEHQDGAPLPRFTHATLALDFRHKSHHPRDTDNLIASAKALVDTLCAPAYYLDPTPRLGIIPNDSPTHLTWGAVTSAKAPAGSPPGVTVTLTGSTTDGVPSGAPLGCP
jgi:type II secretory pathway pseudopilin PulG